MKRIKVTMALVDDNGAAVHQRERLCYITKATPDRPMMLQGSRSLARHFMLCDLDRFWTEVVMLGLLDEYAVDWHMPELPGGESGRQFREAESYGLPNPAKRWAY